MLTSQYSTKVGWKGPHGDGVGSSYLDGVIFAVAHKWGTNFKVYKVKSELNNLKCKILMSGV